MTRRRQTIPPVPLGPAHRRTWQSFWRRCSCGLAAPCIDSLVPATPFPFPPRGDTRPPAIPSPPRPDPVAQRRCNQATTPIPPGMVSLRHGSPSDQPPIPIPQRTLGDRVHSTQDTAFQQPPGDSARSSHDTDLKRPPGNRAGSNRDTIQQRPPGHHAHPARDTIPQRPPGNRARSGRDTDLQRPPGDRAGSNRDTIPQRPSGDHARSARQKRSGAPPQGERAGRDHITDWPGRRRPEIPDGGRAFPTAVAGAHPSPTRNAGTERPAWTPTGSSRRCDPATARRSNSRWAGDVRALATGPRSRSHYRDDLAILRRRGKYGNDFASRQGGERGAPCREAACGGCATDAVRGRRAPDTAPGRSAPDTAPGQGAPDTAPGRSVADTAPGRGALTPAPGRPAPDPAPGQGAPDTAPGRRARGRDPVAGTAGHGLSPHQSALVSVAPGERDASEDR